MAADVPESRARAARADLILHIVDGTCRMARTPAETAIAPEATGAARLDGIGVRATAVRALVAILGEGEPTPS